MKAIILCVAIMFGALFINDSALRQELSAGYSTNLAYDTFELVNQERLALGIQPLVWSDMLADYATEHSHVMFATGIFEHSNLNYGENIAMSDGGFGKSELFTTWRDSPRHYENMIDPSYHIIGIGVYSEVLGKTYATMLLF